MTMVTTSRSLTTMTRTTTKLLTIIMMTTTTMPMTTSWTVMWILILNAIMTLRTIADSDEYSNGCYYSYQRF